MQKIKNRRAGPGLVHTARIRIPWPDAHADLYPLKPVYARPLCPYVQSTCSATICRPKAKTFCSTCRKHGLPFLYLVVPRRKKKVKIGGLSSQACMGTWTPQLINMRLGGAANSSSLIMGSIEPATFFAGRVAPSIIHFTPVYTGNGHGQIDILMGDVRVMQSATLTSWAEEYLFLRQKER